MSYSVLITGANRGIGLGLVRRFLQDDKVSKLFAAARNPDQATELSALSDPRLQVIKLDVQCDDSIKAAANTVKSSLGESPLNLLINNAGVYVKYPVDAEPNRADINRCLDVNATSVLVMSQVFLPLLDCAVKSSDSSEMSAHRAGVVNISSGLASIGDNTSGSGPMQSIVYRASKSCLNSMMKTLSLDLKERGILCVSFCPGWVQTDMGGPKAMITADESANALHSTIAGLSAEHNGGYFKRDGTPIPF